MIWSCLKARRRCLGRLSWPSGPHVAGYQVQDHTHDLLIRRIVFLHAMVWSTTRTIFLQLMYTIRRLIPNIKITITGIVITTHATRRVSELPPSYGYTHQVTDAAIKTQGHCGFLKLIMITFFRDACV